MENRINGIHHITAIASNAKRNHDFYTRVLGLRLVKKTVNFDDPGTYHFYYGDETGTPGTILTFFPWEGMTQGRTGVGMATEIGYSVPEKSLKFWIERFKKYNVKYSEPSERFGEQILPFQDPDGLQLVLIISKTEDKRKQWETQEVDASVATKGFHSITLTLMDKKGTERVLTDILGYQIAGTEGNRTRYTTDAVENASIIDIVEAPFERRANNAGGTIHHIAFRVKDEETLMKFREKVEKFGLNITEKIDRQYFYSLYFREPGGVLFEIATDNPGFAIDEDVKELGSNLKLPPRYERSRKEIEKILPVLNE
jgi:glyoxalase family protein